MDSAHRICRNRSRLSISLPIPAIDPEISGHNLIPTPETTLPDRLTKLARLTVTRAWISHHDLIIINHCLDTIESLVDPRAALTKEISQYRPRSAGFAGAGLVATNSTTADHRARLAEEDMTSRLADLLHEVTALKNELDERRKESTQIYALFEDRCRGLERRAREREFEIDGLQADIFEDTIEMEWLRGTVHGLERWVGDWQQQHDLDLAREFSDRSSKQGRRALRRSRGQNESDELLLEGIMAWIRGWKDVEEGFQARERERRLQREEREHLRISVDYESTALPRLWENRTL